MFLGVPTENKNDCYKLKKETNAPHSIDSELITIHHNLTLTDCNWLLTSDFWNFLQYPQETKTDLKATNPLSRQPL